MSVLLINPLQVNYNFAFENVGFSALPPLGLASLASFIREKGIEVNILDANAERLDLGQTILRIKEHSPKVIGITASTIGIENAITIASKIKEIDPTIFTVLGGPHLTALPRETLESCKELDCGVIGEGEITFFELCQAILSNNREKIDEISGLVYRKDGNIYLTSPRELIPDIDILPFPARNLLPLELYKPTLVKYKKKSYIPLICSRGCPYRCIFCTKGIFGTRVRVRTPEKVYAELKFLKDTYGVDEIDFFDDSLNYYPEWLEKVCELLKSLRLVWKCNLIVNNVSLPLLEKIKGAGCYQINLGVETGNEKTLKLLKKPFTLKQVRKAFEFAHKVELQTNAFTMLGIPGENWDDMLRTIDFIISLKTEEAVFTLFTPYPGTEVYQNMDKYGKLVSMDFSKFICITKDPIFVPFTTTEQELKEILPLAYKKFVLQPRYVYLRLKDVIKNPKKFIPYAKGAIALFTQKTQ